MLLNNSLKFYRIAVVIIEELSVNEQSPVLQGWIVCVCLCTNRNEAASCYSVPNVDVFIVQVEFVINSEVCTKGRGYLITIPWVGGKWVSGNTVTMYLRN